jgi:hypothetical protein
MNDRLTGEAPWKASKERIAKNNDATFARARQARIARDAEANMRRLAAERDERMHRPVQPSGR